MGAPREAVFQGISFGQEPTIPAVVNASLLAASAERSQYGTVPAELVPRASAVSQPDKAAAGASVVSISGSLPKPLQTSGSLVIPPQPSGPISVPSSKPPSVSASGASFEPVRLGGTSTPPRVMSRPPAGPVAPGVPLEYEPTPAAGQPPVDPDGATEQAPAISPLAESAVQSPAVAEPVKPASPAPVPAGRELPPWVWAAILAVVCLLALLAGLFGR